MRKAPNHSAGQRARMTSKGQVTIPKAIRDQLGLEAGRHAATSGSTRPAGSW